MLTVKDLSVVYGHGSNRVRAVDSVSFTIPPGSTLALVGESGSGKSTIARAIVGLAPVSAGEIWLDGRQVRTNRSVRSREFKRKVQMVFQDPFASLNPRMDIGTALGEAVGTRGALARSARADEVNRLLGLVQLPKSALHRFPHEFSGGQRQRIAIARALAAGPEVLLMDEVTSALDVSVQATILNLLKDLQDELSLTYLFISHDLSVVSTMSDEIAVLYLGRLMERAGARDVVENAVHPYTRGLVASIPGHPAAGTSWRPLGRDIPDPRNPPPGCPYAGRCPVGPLVDPTRGVCQETDPRVGASGRAHGAACHFGVGGPVPITIGGTNAADSFESEVS